MSEFVKALAAAQAEMGNATFNKVNPHFKSRYADYAAVRGVALPPLNKHGFAVINTLIDEPESQRTFLRTELAHVSGESRCSLFFIPPGTPQQVGSSITYAKRYNLSAIACLATEEDDDGNEASSPPPGKLKSAAQIKQPDQFPAIEKAIRTCKTVDELKRYALEAGRIMVDWREMDKRHVRAEYDRRMTELMEGVTEDGNVENG